MSDKVRSKKREKATDLEKQAMTIRLDDDLYKLTHAIAGERQESFNEAIHYILDDWWRRKSDRARYETFTGVTLRRR